MGETNGHANGAGEEREPLEKPMAPADGTAADLTVAQGKEEAAKGEDGAQEESTEASAAKKVKGKEAKAKTPSVPLWKLYSRADSIDHLLMALGTLGAICLGAAMPCLSLLFGQLTNSFGQNTNPDAISEAVTTVSCTGVLLAPHLAMASKLPELPPSDFCQYNMAPLSRACWKGGRFILNREMLCVEPLRVSHQLPWVAHKRPSETAPSTSSDFCFECCAVLLVLRWLCDSSGSA